MRHYSRKQRNLTPKRKSRLIAISLLLALSAFAMVASASIFSSQFPTTSAAAQGDDISPEALAQIEALLSEKESRTPMEKKMDSQLIYELKMDRGQAIASGIRVLDTDIPLTDSGKAELDINAIVSENLLDQLKANGAEIVNIVPDQNSVRAKVPLDNLEAIAALSEVMFIQPKQDALNRSAEPRTAEEAMSPAASEHTFNQRALKVRTVLTAALQSNNAPNVLANLPPTGQGSQTSEGDLTHRAFAARGTFHVDGTGIKIGVLSDGVQNLAASQASGDLGPVTVLPGQTGTGDEGTAILEIIHDLAPGAQLYFASANPTITQFAQNIRDLRNAGCDIIIDDFIYFAETPFQDGQLSPTNTNGGVVIQAVNDITASGTLYFSSAGNEGNVDDGTAGVWEGNFVDGGPTGSPLPAGRLHNFGGQNFDTLTVNGSTICLFWSDPLGGSSNDYDLFRLNAAGTAVAASSTNVQNGTQDPFERIASNTANPRIVIVKKTGAANRFLHLNTFRGRLSIATTGQTHGHSAAADAFSVAATPAVGPFPNPFSGTNVSETFTSDGPRRVFFRPDGTPYTPGNLSATGGILRQKPDITAADGVSVTGVGGFGSPFFGTSASAPHAAAIAALLKSASPGLTPGQIRALLTSTSIDIESPGVDRNTGAGIVMAYNVLQAAGVSGTADVEFGNITATEDPGNGDSSISAGEGAKLVIDLKNFGINEATGISATLSSSTPGITIQKPNVSAYPDLPAFMGGATNSMPFRFTVASNVSCPLIANFTLAVSYIGGPSPKLLHFTVPIGPTLKINSTLDATSPSLPVGFTSAITGSQLGRLNRFAPASSCGANKPNPGLFTTGDARRYDAYTFTACNNSCITVSNNTGNVNLFTVVYSGPFNPANVTANWFADPGNSSSGTPFSFNVTAGQTYTIVVHEVNPGGGTGNNYSLNVFGCLVNCSTINQVPVAKAKNITVSAGPECTAMASVDDRSFDPDGDPITIVQSPTGPFPLGTTSVLLTVTDPSGATSQATATVTVVDSTGPDLTDVSFSPSALWPPNHQMVPVTISYESNDSCNAFECDLSVSSNEPVNGLGDGDIGPDWVVVDQHHVLLRSERSGKGNGRTYTITIDCVDAAGNHTIRTANVNVPKSQTGR